MREIQIDIRVQQMKLDELPDADRQLVERAKEMTTTSYSPYSHFQVGAALLLADGTVYGGSNQENAAFPTGLCAERTAFFYAQSRQPDVTPVAIAIAAQTGGSFTAQPVSPCGSCRQALLEAETRYHQPIRVLLYGTQVVYVVRSVTDLLPLLFDGSELSHL